jgi:hypothetical protein
LLGGNDMPKKIRELRGMVKKSGYELQPKRGKGSHTWWEHPLMPDFPLCISGKDGDDADRYIERDVARALRLLAQRLSEQEEGK